MKGRFALLTLLVTLFKTSVQMFWSSGSSTVILEVIGNISNTNSFSFRLFLYLPLTEFHQKQHFVQCTQKINSQKDNVELNKPHGDMNDQLSWVENWTWTKISHKQKFLTQYSTRSGTIWVMKAKSQTDVLLLLLLSLWKMAERLINPGWAQTIVNCLSLSLSLIATLQEFNINSQYLNCFTYKTTFKGKKMQKLQKLSHSL